MARPFKKKFQLDEESLSNILQDANNTYDDVIIKAKNLFLYHRANLNRMRQINNTNSDEGLPNIGGNQEILITNSLNNLLNQISVAGRGKIEIAKVLNQYLNTKLTGNEETPFILNPNDMTMLNEIAKKAKNNNEEE